MSADSKTPSSAAAKPGLAAVAFPQFHADTSSLLLGLIERASENLSADDLAHISGMTEDAECMVRQIATLCDGLGCLVAADGENGKSAGTGSFQTGDDLSNLLWAIGSMAAHAAGIFDAVSRADHLSRNTRVKS